MVVIIVGYILLFIVGHYMILPPMLTVIQNYITHLLPQHTLPLPATNDEALEATRLLDLLRPDTWRNHVLEGCIYR